MRGVPLRCVVLFLAFGAARGDERPVTGTLTLGQTSIPLQTIYRDTAFSPGPASGALLQDALVVVSPTVRYVLAANSLNPAFRNRPLTQDPCRPDIWANITRAEAQANRAVYLVTFADFNICFGQPDRRMEILADMGFEAMVVFGPGSPLYMGPIFGAGDLSGDSKISQYTIATCGSDDLPSVFSLALRASTFAPSYPMTLNVTEDITMRMIDTFRDPAYLTFNYMAVTASILLACYSLFLVGALGKKLIRTSPLVLLCIFTEGVAPSARVPPRTC